jgi:hypothetical protein
MGIGFVGCKYFLTVCDVAVGIRRPPLPPSSSVKKANSRMNIRQREGENEELAGWSS